MKNFPLIPVLLLCINIQLFGQTNLVLILDNPLKHPIKKVDVFDLSQKEYYEFPYQDTLKVAFLKTNVDYYNIRYHDTKGKMYRQQVWLDAANVTLKAHLDSQSMRIDTVLNSPVFYEVKAFSQQYAAFAKAKDSSALNTFLIESFQRNSKNPFSLVIADTYVRLNQNSKLNLLKLKPHLEEQGTVFSWHVLYGAKEKIEKILSTEKIQIDQYTFFSQAGEKTKLSLGKADYYILDLWFLACAPCIQQHKTIQQRLADLKQRNIELIGISTDQNQSKWQEYLVKHPYSWRNYRQNSESPLTTLLDIHTFPTYIILDKTGRIIETYNDFDSVLRRFKL